MRVAGQHGSRTVCDLNRVRCRAGGTCQKPRLRADRNAHQVVCAHVEVLIGKPCVDLAHDLLPQGRRRVARSDNARGRIVADPYGAGIVRRKTDKVTVAVAVGRAGLTGDGHPGECRTGTGTARAVDNALQKLDHRIGGAFLHRNVGLALVVKDRLAVVILDLDIGARHGIDAVVGKGGIGRRHFKRRHAAAQTAQRQSAGRGNIVAGERRKVKLVRHEGVGRRRRQRLQHTHRRGVGGKAHRVLQRDDALVAGIGIHRPDILISGAAHHRHGIIVDHGRRRDHAGVNGRGIDGKRLDCRAAGAGIDGIAPFKRAAALAHTAGKRHHIARGVVDDRHAGLKLLALGGGVVQIAAVAVDPFHDLLDLGIDRTVDLIAAGVEHVLGNVRAVSELLHQIADDIVEDLLDKVGIIGRVHRADLGFPAGGNIILVPDKHQLFVQRLLILRIVQIAQLVHLVEHGLLALLVLLAVGLPAVERALAGGVVQGGILRDADDGRALRDGQVADVLSEVDLGRRLNAAGAVTEIDQIQIKLQHLFTGIVLRKAKRAEDLQHLAPDRHLVVAREVLDDLLRDRGAAAGRVAAAQHVENGARRALPVHAVVLKEPLVLNGNQRLPDMVGNILKIHQRAVFQTVDLRQLLPLARRPVLIVDRGALLERIG